MIDASRCPACRRHDVPPVERCPACRSETEPTTLPARGTTIARTRRPGASWIALVELDASARVYARLDDTPRIGDDIDLVELEEDSGAGFRGNQPGTSGTV